MFRHIHIVACSPRSGTTLLHEVMVTCLRTDRHYDHEMRFHLVEARDGEVLITKRPKDTMYMPALLDDDPELYVIYLLRDPRDVICSRHGKDRSIYYSNIRLWRQMQGYARRIAHHPRFVQIRYEDFVSDPDATQQLIEDRFPWLESLHRFSEYHEYAEVSEKSRTAMHSVRPITPSSIGVWKKNPARIKAQQEIHGSLTPDLIECGYETSGDWERALENVEPDRTRSLYPEKLYIWSRFSQYLNGLRKVSRYRRLRGLS